MKDPLHACLVIIIETRDFVLLKLSLNLYRQFVKYLATWEGGIHIYIYNLRLYIDITKEGFDHHTPSLYPSSSYIIGFPLSMRREEF